MKEKISHINNSIDAKSTQLKGLAQETFGSISDLSSTSHSDESQDRKTYRRSNGSKSLISKILYGASALFASGAIGAKIYDWIKQRKSEEENEGSNNLCAKLFSAAMLSATGGFVLSKMNLLNPSKSTSTELIDDTTVKFDGAAIKNEAVSMGIAAVKNITNDWEEFMEKNQKDIFAFIDSSSLSESQKDGLSSKIYSYEVIDINLSELMATVNKASSLREIAESLENFKTKLIYAINQAANKQKSKYDSLNSQLLIDKYEVISDIRGT